MRGSFERLGLKGLGLRRRLTRAGAERAAHIARWLSLGSLLALLGYVVLDPHVALVSPAPAVTTPTPTAAAPTSTPASAPSSARTPTEQASPAPRPVPEAGKIRELHDPLDSKQTFYVYVPKSYDGVTPHSLLVAVHGAGRTARLYAQRFIPYAEEHRAIILAPLFPEGVRFQDLEKVGKQWSDMRLLNLVGEVARHYKLDGGKFDLFGYSAGAQFSLRFLYAHPEALRTVVIGAPGTVMLPSEKYKFPSGVADYEEIFGQPFRLEAMREPKVMLLVGKQDLTNERLNTSAEAMQFGKTRLERARTLHQAWLASGIDHEYVEIPGVGHGVTPEILDPSWSFLATQQQAAEAAHARALGQ
jgi:pimeloyl-ACP methyl ester carboxylesterase